MVWTVREKRSRVTRAGSQGKERHLHKETTLVNKQMVQKLLGEDTVTNKSGRRTEVSNHGSFGRCTGLGPGENLPLWGFVNPALETVAR